MDVRQSPASGDFILRWKGDRLVVTLTLVSPREGRAVFRSNFGAAAIARREIVAQNDADETPLAQDWNDRPMAASAPGEYRCEVPLDEVGVFSGTCCFLPSDGGKPIWPSGGNFRVKVEPSATRGGNAIYTVFPRQFGSFREVVRRLDFIMGTMGFNIVQTLPVFPVPTTYAVMGKLGCPFAATDFFSVDPALAEFDARTTPLDQFRELIDAVHARGGRLFVDLPANHTGWASTLQTHHPEWFRRAADGRFISPGAWGVTWADLVELDYAHPELRAYMAEVFLFWVRLGVDGFRCDAGYMIPVETWTYIVARVRDEEPETVFMLEGLGGEIEVTDRLLMDADLDWAYSEIFQTPDRAAFERYLPGAIARARRAGALVHFAETHDNDRLAKQGEAWARLRVALAALLSHQGAWGIANGVEWFATEKIDVHDRNDLNWGAPRNMVDFIARLNGLVSSHLDFAGNEPLDLIMRGPGNFLAVRRGSTLILANLDCGCGVTAQWDERLFPGRAACEDLLLRCQVQVENGLWLNPGEVRVLALETDSCASGAQPTLPKDVEAEASDSVVWRYPDDLAREVVVPPQGRLHVEIPYAFRVRIIDGEKTYSGTRSDGTPAVLEVPPCRGDGTCCTAYRLELTVHEPTGTRHARASIRVPPPPEKARMKRVYSGAEIRRDPSLEAVLSDGAGSASRVRLAWGRVQSQYDALFAVNVNPHVPADRLTLWTRCRVWLQVEGTSREVNADCIDSFHADPAGREAVWCFAIPYGMGRVAKFRFCLSLAQDGTGKANLVLTRLSEGAADAAETVRLVLRPDLEWRSFHATTKARGAVEQAFASATRVLGESGFDFAPYGHSEHLVMHVARGVFHPEGQWTYCLSHAEEAERGQDGCGDVFSPGWISCDLACGEESVVTAIYVSDARVAAFDEQEAARLLSERMESKSPPREDPPFAEALRESLRLFVARRDDVRTVIAGYPWFLDWGRDTFIFLQGAIAAGFSREALHIVEAFARFEEKGTLPNIISGETAGNRDTVDAPLWFIRTLAALGDEAKRFRPVAESIVESYVRGTPNGIHVDAASGLVWSPAHFTWMDTNYPACTPRVGYPVEIQALWIAALRHLGGERWNVLADRASESFLRLFARTDEVGGLYDCLDAPNGESAVRAVPDRGVRPNQLFAVSLGTVPADSEVARSIVRACACLVVPGGVRSLASGDSRYRGVYAGDEDTSRKPAYHNGTVWAWPFPLYAEALAKTGLASKKTARTILASVVDNLNSGCVCQISEIADGDAPHAQKGCRAQAWSVSEVLRVWLSLA